jgi:hypothetical protein
MFVCGFPFFRHQVFGLNFPHLLDGSLQNLVQTQSVPYVQRILDNFMLLSKHINILLYCYLLLHFLQTVVSCPPATIFLIKTA